ncbi:FAD/NAD(P)-binding domain-containing protein [Rhizodiscina lignyota]|uniref:FAD/NAD(P)-binding domain-containing protein n=1 Tax=Rhizodiscina lignyota TaxID=1504668 RepID=A0A9P4I6Z9_9PEZI|nr:FAD/NAD(P)-binding domain-containing protein [Rhizodiscina lignyota]
MASTASPRTKILVVGGSYGGLSASLNLLDLCHGKNARSSPVKPPDQTDKPKLPVEITIVDERDGFFHTIGAPLALASEEYAAKAWIKAANIPALRHPDISWVHGSVTSIDTSKHTASITRIDTSEPEQHRYDYLIAASGLRRVWPTVPQSLTKKSYILEAERHIDAVKDAHSGVVVVGGGAVGVEMAAELKVAQPQLKVTLIHSRDKLLSNEPLPDELKDKTCDLLKEGGVEVVLGRRVVHVEPITKPDGKKCNELELSDGTRMRACQIISAISKPVPTTTYLPLECLNTDGLVKVNNKLQFSASDANHNYHYAIGDMVARSGIKRCGGAIYGAVIAATNVYQQMLNEQDPEGRAPKFEEMPEAPPMIALAVGKKAIAYHPAEGVKYGADVMQHFFQDDLALIWFCTQLDLGIKPSETAEVK